MDPARLFADEAFARRIASGLLRDKEGAADLVQEAWLEILAKPPKHASGLRGYLALVLRRLVFRRRQADAAREARERAVARGEAQGETSALVARAEIHQRTVATVLTLAEPYRTTVLLRFFEDCSPEEIAARERIPVETVRTRLKRALALLRARLEREGGDWREEWAIALYGGSSPKSGLSRSGERAASPHWGVAALTVAAVASIFLIRQRLTEEQREARGFSESADTVAAARVSSTAAEGPAFEGDPRHGREPEIPVAAPTPLHLLSGRVTDRDGRPLSGVRVLMALSSVESAELSRARSDSDGRFSLSLAGWSGLSSSARGLLGLVVEAWASGHALLTRDLELGPDGMPAELTLVLEPGRILSGRVLDAAGTPVVSALAVVDGSKYMARPTDSEGWFAVGLEPGVRVTDLLVFHRHGGYAYRDALALPADTRGDVELGTIVLQRAHVLSGRCIHPDGTPVRGLPIEARLAEPVPGGGFRSLDGTSSTDHTAGLARVKLRTDELGRFATCGLRDGPFQLLSGGKPLAGGTAWHVDGPELEIVLDDHHLVVEVAGPDGRLLAQARVAVTRLSRTGEPEGRPLRTLTSGAAPLALVRAEPGESLAVLATVPGCAPVEEHIEIPARPYEISLRLRLSPDDRPAAIVLRPSAGPRDDWSVDLCAPLSGVPLPGLQDLVPSNGRVIGLPLGTYRVRLDPRPSVEPAPGLPMWAASATPSVTLLGGETTLAFASLPAARLRVLFTGAGASAASPTPVALDPARFESAGTDSDRWSWMQAALMPAGGSLELWSLASDEKRPLRRLTGLRPRAGQTLDLVVPAGPMRLRLQLDDGQPLEVEVFAASRETVDVTFPLPEVPSAR